MTYPFKNMNVDTYNQLLKDHFGHPLKKVGNKIVCAKCKPTLKKEKTHEKAVR